MTEALLGAVVEHQWGGGVAIWAQCPCTATRTGHNCYIIRFQPIGGGTPRTYCHGNSRTDIPGTCSLSVAQRERLIAIAEAVHRAMEAADE